jgi:hypothetical protein
VESSDGFFNNLTSEQGDVIVEAFKKIVASEQ